MKKIFFALIAIMFLFSSCFNKLQVENDNNPDIEDVLSDPEAVYELTASLFYSWDINVMTHSWSPAMAMMTMADQGSSSWANSGMLDLSSEPRAPFDNSESYTYAYIFEHYWDKMYSVIGQTNNILRLLDGGMKIGDTANSGVDETELVRAVSYFIQGISYGYLGLVYDKAFIVTEHSDYAGEFSPQSYDAVIDTAMASLQKCISVCETSDFTVPDDWFNGKTYSNSELAQLAYSYMARFLVYKARTAAENDQTDWQKVLDYANNGITSEFQIYYDNVDWKHWLFHYTYERDDWVRIDARIIHLMDPSYPWRLDSGTDPGVATSDDARLGTDFVHDNTCPFRPERGYYHFSFYVYHRYQSQYTFSTPGFMPEYTLTELELIKAEAYARLGQLSSAINIINSGSRVNRGQLTPLSAASTKEQILDAVFYERDIELVFAGFGIGFFDMRRRDMLQKGTMLHFPIPAKELNVDGLEVYTFGGEENADGVNTSNGGWFPQK